MINSWKDSETQPRIRPLTNPVRALQRETRRIAAVRKRRRESSVPRVASKRSASNMPPKRRTSPTNAPNAKKPRAKAQDTEEAYVEGDAWLLPALHKHGGEDFEAVANDPAFDGPRRGRTA